MSSSSANGPEEIISETTVIVSQTASKAKSGREELRKDIHKLGSNTLKSLGGFRTFILRGNVVDLAIGIVIGAAFSSVVDALVSDIITPLIPVSNSKGLSTWVVSIPHTYITLQIGGFINAVISFLIVAVVLYFLVVQPINALMALYNLDSAFVEMRECPYCCQKINTKAKRCPYCTSQLGEVAPKKAPAQ